MAKHSKKMKTVNQKPANFERQNRLVAGIDIGASSIYVCIGLPDGRQVVREYSTAQMNIQLNQVLSNITGVTGMSIIRAIVGGERNPLVLAQLRDARCQNDEETVAKALEGNFRPELVFSLKQAIEAFDFYQKQIEACDYEIQRMLNDQNKPGNNLSKDENAEKEVDYHRKNKSAYHFDVVEHLNGLLGVDLTEIPGIDGNTVMKIVAEIGTNMSHWPTEKHFASWLGLCPGNKISGGKILSSKTKPTANKAAQALRMAANATQKTKSAIGAFFRKIKARKGVIKAITATAHKIAVIIYSMIKNRQTFKDIGQEEYEQRHKERSMKNLKRRAKEMGFELVEIIA